MRIYFYFLFLILVSFLLFFNSINNKSIYGLFKVFLIAVNLFDVLVLINFCFKLGLFFIFLIVFVVMIICLVVVLVG